MKVPLATSCKRVALENFYNALYLYHERPHLVNRKLCGVSTLFHYKITFNASTNQLDEVLTNISISYEVPKLPELTKEHLSSLLDLLRPYDQNIQIQHVSQAEFRESPGVFISIQVLLPSFAKHAKTVQLTVWDKQQHFVLFVCSGNDDKFQIIAPPFAYKFQLDNAGILQLIVDVEHAESVSSEWLAEKLFPKVLKWSEEKTNCATNPSSLSLISVEAYSSLYKALKEKYGRKIVDIWPETTDPLKFVYEDIAIASYLICLWQSISKKPSFIDLGCGNGLLVHILSEEGYDGFGVDVRSRKIWEMYPCTTKLMTHSVKPSDVELFSDIDWIIGNHSDELTPWIPVFAARCNINFFLLPCCCYNFDGSKYIRRNPSVSQYSDYLQYVETICSACDFLTKRDKLRIPSTKRICFVSFGKINSIDANNIELNIQKLIGQKEFKARKSAENVRNCTQLNRDFVNGIIKKLVTALLTLESRETREKVDKTIWNAGGTLTISDLAKCITNYELKGLKNECGGLQTLMKNHRYIFDVAKGSVKLRLPYLAADTKKYAEKYCWFYRNHPNGCLHSDDFCACLH